MDIINKGPRTIAVPAPGGHITVKPGREAEISEKTLTNAQMAALKSAGLRVVTIEEKAVKAEAEAAAAKKAAEEAEAAELAAKAEAEKLAKSTAGAPQGTAKK